LNTDNFTGRYLFGTCIVADVGTHNPDNIKIRKPVTEDAHYSTAFLLQQCGLILFKVCNLEFQLFKIFNV